MGGIGIAGDFYPRVWEMGRYVNHIVLFYSQAAGTRGELQIVCMEFTQNSFDFLVNFWYTMQESKSKLAFLVPL